MISRQTIAFRHSLDWEFGNAEGQGKMAKQFQ